MVELAPGTPATVDGLQISVEQYFPDFALDEKQQPYSRSAEPRNPAALLRVTRGEKAWRVFVIRAMPGIHRPEGLDHVLSLTDVVVSEAVTLRVSREPAAAVALAGMTVMALGMAWAARPA
jgi:cytochrome c biogenesis protein